LAVRGSRHEIDIQLVKTRGRMVEEILKFTGQLHKTSYGTGVHNCQIVLNIIKGLHMNLMEIEFRLNRMKF